MNAYSKFINDTFSIISEILPKSGNPLSFFSYGEKSSFRTNGSSWHSDMTNDFASLNNLKAALFYALVVQSADLFGVDHSSVKLRRHKMFQDNITIQHSCYSKNLKRWMNGQKSRKALNRLEYVILLYCWSVDWYESGYMDQSHIHCRNELTSLCKRRLKTSDSTSGLLELLWYASCKSYTDAYAASSSR